MQPISREIMFPLPNHEEETFISERVWIIQGITIFIGAPMEGCHSLQEVWCMMETKIRLFCSPETKLTIRISGPFTLTGALMS